MFKKFFAILLFLALVIPVSADNISGSRTGDDGNISGARTQWKQLSGTALGLVTPYTDIGTALLPIATGYFTNLTVATIVISSAVSGDMTITNADPTLFLNSTTAGDTDFWIGVQEDAGGTDNDSLQIGTGGTKGTNSKVTLTNAGAITFSGSCTANSAVLDGGTNTFSITNGTASFDVAAASTVDINQNLTVSGSATTFTNGLTFGATNGGTIDFAAGSKSLTIEDNSYINQDLTTDASVTFAGLSNSDSNVTNVGDIALDSISSDAGTTVQVTLGTDAGDDFQINNGSNIIRFEGDTGKTILANNTWLAGIDSAGTGVVNMIKVNASDQIELGGALSIGDTINLVEDGGAIRLVNMNVSSSAADGTEESYSFGIDNTDIITVYAESDGAGGIDTESVKLLYSSYIGQGTADTDYSLTFDGESDDGVITYKEDENNFNTGDSGFMSAKVTADPCGTFEEGAIFYNDTSNYYCYCDGTNDVQLHDPSTACF